MSVSPWPQVPQSLHKRQRKTQPHQGMAVQVDPMAPVLMPYLDPMLTPC